MGLIARHTGVVAFGGPPGYGGDLKRYGEIRTIPAKLRRHREIRSRRQVYLPRTTERRFSRSFRTVYESAELGSGKLDIFGFLQYSP
jgi:hypothetical protein